MTPTNIEAVVYEMRGMVSEALTILRNRDADHEDRIRALEANEATRAAHEASAKSREAATTARLQRRATYTACIVSAVIAVTIAVANHLI